MKEDTKGDWKASSSSVSAEKKEKFATVAIPVCDLQKLKSILDKSNQSFALWVLSQFLKVYKVK